MVQKQLGKRLEAPLPNAVDEFDCEHVCRGAIEDAVLQRLEEIRQITILESAKRSDRESTHLVFASRMVAVELLVGRQMIHRRRPRSVSGSESPPRQLYALARLWRIIFVVPVAWSAVSAACNTPSSLVTAPVHADVVLALGQEAAIEGTQIRVRFAGVVSDSRCPTDVVCVQAGEAVVRIEVGPNSASRASLDLRETAAPSAHYSDLRITLLDLSPRPISTTPTPQSKYRAKLRIDRN